MDVELENLRGLVETIPKALGHVGLIVWGLVDGFFGWRFFKFTLIASGFAAGAAVAAFAAIHLAGVEGFAAAGASAVGGLLGAYLAFRIFVFAVFIQGVALGSFAGVALAAHLGWTGFERYYVPVVAGLVLGTVLSSIYRSVVILWTALVGGLLTTFATGYFFGLPGLFSLVTQREFPGLQWVVDTYANPVLLGVAGLLALAGAATQFGAESRGKKRAAED